MSTPSKVGSHEISTFNDSYFELVRETDELKPSFVDDAFGDAALEFKQVWGMSIARSKNFEFLVRELTKEGHETLLSIAEDYGEYYADKKSLLAPIYLHFSFETGGPSSVR